MSTQSSLSGSINDLVTSLNYNQARFFTAAKDFEPSSKDAYIQLRVGDLIESDGNASIDDLGFGINVNTFIILASNIR